MKMQRWLGILAFSISLASTASAEPVAATPIPTPPSALGSNVLRAEEILDRWLRGSVEVASWRREIGASRFDVISAKVLPNPELMLAGVKLLDGTAPDGNSGVQAQITQPLPIFGQVGARKRAAEAQVTIAEANLLNQAWERAGDIQSELVTTAFAAARIAMYERNLGEIERIEKIIATRTAAGANSQYDVLRVQSTSSTIRAAITQATIERRRSETKLLSLIADPTLATVSVAKEGLTGFSGPEDETALIALALQRRPDLLVARRSATGARLMADRFRKDAIPTPSVFIQGYWVQKPYGTQLTGGVSIPVPVFDRNQGQVGRSVVEAESQELLTSALEARVRAEVSGLWRSRRDAREARDDFRTRTLANAAQMISRAEVTYQAGTFSIAELLDAYRTLWDARIQELELDRQSAEAEAELEHASVLLPMPKP